MLLEDLFNTHSITTLLIATVTALLSYSWLTRVKNLPPGPTGLPIIGNLFVMATSRDLGTKLTALQEKYGKIMHLKLGKLNAVVLSDADIIKEAFNGPDFVSRGVKTIPALNKVFRGKEIGVMFSARDANIEMRRFTLLALRDFGVGRQSLDDQIQTEASILCRHLEEIIDENEGVVSGVYETVQLVAANIIHNIVFGFRHAYDNKEYHKILGHLRTLFSFNPIQAIGNFIPGIPIPDSFFSNFLVAQREIEKYVTAQIDDHRSSYQEGEIRDFADNYIKYEKMNKEHYYPDMVLRVVIDLFAAGSDTTATTLEWMILFLVKYPHIQKQLLEEIDEHVGDQVFKRAEKSKLVKTRAFINETIRAGIIVDLGVPHSNSSGNATLGGYFIPKDTIILINLHAMHMDKDYWGDPENFRIERWIDDKGHLLSHDKHFMPFSVGRRACIGKQLATIEITIFLVTLLQNFRFEAAPGYEQLGLEARSGITRRPQPFDFKIVKRS